MRTCMDVRVIGGVFVAGGIGAVLRVLLVSVLDTRLAVVLPGIGTLVVNLVGCFAIGVLSMVVTGELRPVVLGGLLGGFTTYSAFALLGAQLAKEGRVGLLGVQLAVHILGGIACVGLGIALVKGLGLARGP